jgi:hypothetical protein
MKKLTALAMSVAVCTSLVADIKPYVGAGLGIMATPDQTGAKNALGMSLRGGATGFVAMMPSVGMMFELNKSLTELSDYNQFEDALTFAGYLTYDIIIPNSQFVIRPKFGVILPNASDEINSRDLSFSSGIGGKMLINEQIDVYVDYAVLGEAVTNYSLGVEFKF